MKRTFAEPAENDPDICRHCGLPIGLESREYWVHLQPPEYEAACDDRYDQETR